MGPLNTGHKWLCLVKRTWMHIKNSSFAVVVDGFMEMVVVVVVGVWVSYYAP